MESRTAVMSTRAVKFGSKPPVLPEVAEAKEKAKIERFLQGMAMFEEEQGKKSSSRCGCHLKLTLVSSGQGLFLYGRSMSPCFNQRTSAMG